MNEVARRDDNRITVLMGVTNDADKDIKMLRVDPISKRLLVSADFSLSGVMLASTYDPANGSRQVAFSDEVNTFETVSKNLRTYNYVPTYLGSGLINYLTYTVGTGTIVKTYTYSSDLVSTIVLSGDTPSGIDLTKTFNYTGTTLTSVAYT